MNKHQQSGMTTLLITSMLLIVALLFSLASYKNLFYQIKRTQNEVLARQAHWAAEGGLECGFAQIQKAGNISDAKPTFIDCESLLNLVDVDVDADNYINSKYKNISKKEIKKKITVSPASYGAIQSRSDLKLLGGIVIAPDVIDHIEGNNYKCISVRYSSRVKVVGAAVTNPPRGGLLSYPEFVSGGTCANGYSTLSGGGFDTSVTPPSFTGPVENDFEYDSKLDPFENFFNKKRSDIASVKAEYVSISGSIKASTDPDRCAKRINAAFDLSNKVWVSGDCNLHGDSLGANIDGDLSIINKAKILVFENGIVGASGAVTYNGAVYHLIDNPIFYETSLLPRWEAMDSKDYSTYLNTNSVFFANGAFVPTGGIIFDTPKGVSTYRVSLSLTYDRSFNPYTPKYEARWQQGSWHDF